MGKRNRGSMQGMLLSSIVVEAPRHRRSRGWRLVALLLVGGAGVGGWVVWGQPDPAAQDNESSAVAVDSDTQAAALPVTEEVVTPKTVTPKTVTPDVVTPVVEVKKATPGLAPPSTKVAAKEFASRAGRALFEGQLNKAATVYQALAVGEFFPEWGHIGLAKVALERGDATAAIAHAKKAVATGGGNRARMFLANAQARVGHHRDAIDQYRVVLRFDGDNAAARLGLAKSERALGQHP